MCVVVKSVMLLPAGFFTGRSTTLKLQHTCASKGPTHLIAAISPIDILTPHDGHIGPNML